MSYKNFYPIVTFNSPLLQLPQKLYIKMDLLSKEMAGINIIFIVTLKKIHTTLTSVLICDGLKSYDI